MSVKGTICVAGKNNIACDIMNYLVINYQGEYNFTACCNRTETGTDGWQCSYRAYVKKCGIEEKKLEELYEIDGLIFISAEFDKIIKPDLFKDAALYNIHFSLLPAYRGMYTSVLPILFGEERAGVTLHEIDTGIDTGRIIAQTEFKLDENMISRDLYLRCIDAGKELVIKNMKKLLSGNFESYEQPVKGASYFSKTTVDFGKIIIDLNKTAHQIQNQLRAFSFREYQLPKIANREVAGWRITDRRSDRKSGTILWESDKQARISTADYDMLVDFI